MFDSPSQAVGPILLAPRHLVMSFSFSAKHALAAVDVSAPSVERRRLWAAELPFLACALATLAWLPAQRGLNPLVCLVLVAGFAEASGVASPLQGAGWAPSTQLAFVPMLFFAPLNLVPLMVLASYLASDLAPCLGSRGSPARRVLCLGDSWWTLGPVLVLGVANQATFAWGHWPVYAGALAAQLTLSTLFASLRSRLHGNGPAPLRDIVGLTTLLDIVLTLPALSIAAASGDAPIGAALTWAALLAIVAGTLSERAHRSTSAGESTSSGATSCGVVRTPRRRRPARTPALTPRSRTLSSEAAWRSRRSTSRGSSCLARRSPTAHGRYPIAAEA